MGVPTPPLQARPTPWSSKADRGLLLKMLATTWLILRRDVRRRIASFAGLAVVIALGAGATLGALIAADRTDRAYPDYVRDGGVTDLVVNPSVATRSMDAAIRAFPNARSVHSDSLFLATVSRTDPGKVSDLAGVDATLQVRGSTDGRYEAVDRPVVTEGRFASGNREVFVAEDYREDLEAAVHRRLKVGDTINVAFWWAALDEADLDPEEVVAPIGVEPLRIAGFGRLADEILPDELYPRERLVVSGDVARRYTCRADLRAELSEDEALAAAFPSNCSRSYEYYAIDVAGGSQGKAAIRRSFTSAAKRLSNEIPVSMRATGVDYYYVSQDRADLDRGVRQVTRPTVASLMVFSLVAGLATLAVVALAISRILRRSTEDQRTLRALGATRTERAVIAACPPLVAGPLGLLLAVPVAFAASFIGPTGSVRTVTPVPGLSLPGRVVLPVIALLIVALVLITSVLAWSTSAVTRTDRRAERPRRARRLVASSRPAFAQGVRAAYSTRRSDGGLLMLVGCIMAVTATVAAVVFGTNLTALVREPARYGWPWDVAVITGAGYGDTDAATVTKRLSGSNAVDDFGLFAFDAAMPIAGRPVPAIFAFPGAEDTNLPLIEGRAARQPGEVVLGATTADALGVKVGDRVPIESPDPKLRSVAVVGIGVLPSLGAFIADRTGLGTGAFVPLGLDPTDPELESPATLTGIRLRSGIDPKKYVETLHSALRRWDVFGASPEVYTAAVRPPEIINADSMQAAPLVLGGVLALGLLLALALSIGASVRDRRRELATLRALGFSGRDLRATVRWQATASIAVGLVIGIPLGIGAGRVAWSIFADQLGVVSRVDVPIGWLALVGVAAVTLGLVAATIPARAASRVHASELLTMP